MDWFLTCRILSCHWRCRISVIDRWIAGVIYTVVGTCKLIGVNPEAYLNWVLPQLAGATNKTATGLLPHDYAAVVKERRT